MTVELNGRAVNLGGSPTVADAVERAGAGAGAAGVAVAVDGEIVPRSAWPQTELAEGQRVEVVGAIQGG